MSEPFEQIALPPELQALDELKRAGWRLTAVRTPEGEITRVDGIHALEEPADHDAVWVDTVMVNSATDVKGLRQNPDDDTVWRREGDIVHVVEGLLALPKPWHRLAPRLVLPRAEKLWTP